ncbi:MAG: hypothetical protein ACM359_05650 [Bacillota bacterium]
MSCDPFEKLLKEADAEAGGPRVGGDLAGRVVRAAGRRRMRRRMSGAGVVIMLMLGMGLVIGGRWSNARHVEQLRAEVMELRKEREWRMEMTMRLWERERQWRRLMEARRKAAEVDPMERVQEQVEQAAFSMVYQADRMAGEMGLDQSAAKVYRQVCEDFPATHWAAIARQRLAKMGDGKEG